MASTGKSLSRLIAALLIAAVTCQFAVSLCRQITSRNHVGHDRPIDERRKQRNRTSLS